MYEPASPGRNVGCGLKLVDRVLRSLNLAASPGRNVGCGLKHSQRPVVQVGGVRITRQKCRVWIETSSPRNALATCFRITRQKCRVWIETVMFATWQQERHGITRQKCRVWIETAMLAHPRMYWVASPGRNVGCGLKHHHYMRIKAH